MVARGGKNDVTKQVTFENHKKSIAAEIRTQRINSLMVKTPEESDKLIYAETKFAMFVAELATYPERTQIFVFFSDPDTVLLEYADPNLHLTLLP